MENDQPVRRVATVRRGADVGLPTDYVVEYTTDGKPSGRTFVRADCLDGWRRHLRSGGWTVQDADKEGEQPDPNP